MIVGSDPTHDVFETEFFGPILAVHVYDDADYDATLELVDRGQPLRADRGRSSPTDRAAIGRRGAALRFAAGNFYVNDKPTGAVVGQQPFGGCRASGTNDKAGSCSTCSDGRVPGRSKRTSPRRPTTATRT